MGSIPDGAEPVNRSLIAPFNSYGEPEFLRRGYYLDVNYRCRDCGVKKAWTAKQQKLWYEKEKGQVYSTARYCLDCRKKKRGGPQKKESTPEKKLRDPAKACARLRELGASAPTPQSRREVERFLETGSQPVQSIAAEVLAAWGGRETVEVLRRWLPRILNRRWHSIQSKAGKLLSTCIGKEDEAWVVEFFGGLKDKPAARHWMSPMFRPFSQTQRFFNVLRAESELSTPLERIRALFFLSDLMVKKRENVFEKLKHDPDATVSALAARLAKNPASSTPAYKFLWQYILGHAFLPLDD